VHSLSPPPLTFLDEVLSFPPTFVLTSLSASNFSGPFPGSCLFKQLTFLHFFSRPQHFRLPAFHCFGKTRPGWIFLYSSPGLRTFFWFLLWLLVLPVVRFLCLTVLWVPSPAFSFTVNFKRSVFDTILHQCPRIFLPSPCYALFASPVFFHYFESIHSHLYS